MPQSWKYARVEYNPVLAEMINAQIVGWAAAGELVQKGPGLNQAAAVQLVTDLAVLRHIAASEGRFSSWAIYDAKGRFLRVVRSLQAPDLEEGQEALFMVGDERPPPVALQRRYPKETDPSADWPRQLVLALDRCIIGIKRAEQAGAIPAGFGIETPGGEILPGIGVGGIAVIVGGAAVAVVGAVAVWRYLDPELRTRVASVRAASKAYAERLGVAAATGTMPPPSPIETANAAAVVEAAKDQGTQYWAIAAGALGGIAAGSLLASWLRRRAA